MSGFIQAAAEGGSSFVAMGGDVIGNSNNVTVVSISGGLKVNVTSVSHSTPTYAALSTDYIIATDSTAGIISINLPAAPSKGQIYQIKDSTGQDAINNVTIAGNGHNIDGSATFVMNVAYGSITVVFGTSTWMIV